MSAVSQYKLLLTKVANRISPNDVERVYNYCMSKEASFADNLLWAGMGALPAYVVGQSIAREKERQKHRNYALAGLAAGVVAPKVLGAIVNPGSAFPSTSGFDASDIKNLQIESLD